MRRIIGNAFISVDGVIQAPGAPHEDESGGFAFGGWVAPHWDATLEKHLGGLFAQPYDLLLGYRTYEIFAAYWPHVSAENPIGAAFNRTAKHVLTHRTAPLAWANSHRLADVEAIRALKAGAGPDLLIQGSGSLYPQLLTAGLVDRFTLMTFPITLGRGRRLFGEGTPPKGLRLVEQDVSASGVVVAVYEPAGEVQARSFAEEPPSTDELDRRTRWAREG